MIADHPTLPVQEQVIEQSLLGCGLKADGFTVKYEHDLQSIEIVIAPSAGATADDFACINKAAGYETVTFQDSEMYAAYADFASELARPEMLARYEGELKNFGLWDAFPDRENFASLEEFTAALETHAGVKPGSTLRVSDNGIVFDAQTATVGYAEFAERYSKVLLVATYASIRDQLSFGAIGNARLAP